MWQKTKLILGPVLAFALYVLLQSSSLSELSVRTIAVALLMSWWWLTESLPLAVTSLLPLLVFPLLGISSLATAATPFVHRLVLLFLGGFLLAQAFQRWNVHRRLALWVLSCVGTKAEWLVAAMLGLTALISLWISNTATALMMLPIAQSLIIAVKERHPHAASHFAKALLLGIAYATSIGGMGTPIGTPPNALMIAFVKQELGVEIHFGEWMLVAMPLVLLLLFFTWWLLVKVFFPLHQARFADEKTWLAIEKKRLGPISFVEKMIMLVFSLVVAAWMFLPLLPNSVGGIPLDDTSVCLFGALALFILPSKQGGAILTWSDVKRLPWNILLLFGGGLSLAQALVSSGLIAWFASHLQLFAFFGSFGALLVLVILLIVLSELMSNTAMAASCLPLILGLSEGMQLPMLPTFFAATFATSCAFMLPMGTPPNAMVLASQHVGVRDMQRVGFWLNLFSAVSIVLLCWLLAKLI